MADNDASAPRKTSTYKQFTALNTQDERFGNEDTELFWLENLMIVGDGKLRSIAGPSSTVIPISETGFLLLDTKTGFVRLDDNTGDIKLDSNA